MPTFLRRAIIPHELIHDDLGDMRVIHDAATDAELTASIRDHGVRNPITLRPHPKITDEYQLVDGRRRLRCNKLAGNDSIPAEIYEMSDFEACLDALEKNIQRDDPDPVGLGFWLERIMKENPAIEKQEDLAKVVHKSQSWVSRQLSAYKQALKTMKKEENTDGEPVNIQALQNSKLTERQARALRTATDEIRDRVIDITNIMGEPPSARSIERMIKATKTPQEVLESYDPRNSLFDDSYLAYELMEKAGLTVTTASQMVKNWRQYRLPWQKLEKTTLVDPTIKRSDKDVQLYKKLSEIYPTELLDLVDSVAPAKTFETMSKYCRRLIRKLLMAADAELKQSVLDDFREG